MNKWELKSCKRPFFLFNLETFVLLAVVLILVIPFTVQFCTVPKMNLPDSFFLHSSDRHEKFFTDIF